MEKNKDAVHDDIKGMIKKSAIPFVASLVKEAGGDGDGAAKSKVRGRGGGGSKKKGPTLGGQFKSSLTSLMATLNKTNPSFVRTIKPNKAKQ